MCPPACVSFQESKFDGILFLVQKARPKRLTYALVEASTEEGRTCTGCKHVCEVIPLSVIVKIEKVIQQNDQIEKLRQSSIMQLVPRKNGCRMPLSFS